MPNVLKTNHTYVSYTLIAIQVGEECKGSRIEVELKENGANIPVTLYNRQVFPGMGLFVDF